MTKIKNKTKLIDKFKHLDKMETDEPEDHAMVSLDGKIIAVFAQYYDAWIFARDKIQDIDCSFMRSDEIKHEIKIENCSRVDWKAFNKYMKGE